MSHDQVTWCEPSIFSNDSCPMSHDTSHLAMSHAVLELTAYKVWSDKNDWQPPRPLSDATLPRALFTQRWLTAAPASRFIYSEIIEPRALFTQRWLTAAPASRIIYSEMIDSRPGLAHYLLRDDWQPPRPLQRDRPARPAHLLRHSCTPRPAQVMSHGR